MELYLDCNSHFWTGAIFPPPLSRASQNGADHSDKVEEPEEEEEEEKHENGDGAFKVTCLLPAKALSPNVSMFDLFPVAPSFVNSFI